MKMFLTTTNSQVRGIALVYFVFGLLLCFFDTTVLTVATRILGVIAILYSCYLFYTYFYQKKRRTAMPLYIGVPCLLFGLVFAFSPESLVRIIPVLAGVILILNSVIQMQKSFVMRRYSDSHWIFFLLISTLLLIGGVVLLLQPVQALSYILRLVGAGLIIESIVLLFNLYELRKFSVRRT